MQGITNPKRLSDKVGGASWYHYHAGYSEKFVTDVLDQLDLPEESTILDPWNGTGTTTSIAYQRKHRALGFDMNPALVVIAKARILPLNVLGSIEPLAEDIIFKVHNDPCVGTRDEKEFDPLSLWFVPETTSIIRKLEKVIYSLLVSPKVYAPLFELNSLDKLSSLASFFYVALFKTVRNLVEPQFRSSPVWIKYPKRQEDKLLVTKEPIVSLYLKTVADLKGYMETKAYGHTQIPVTIDHGNVECLPIPQQSVDAVITSPPYCTRIDYAMSMLPELAVLGFSNMYALKNLRDQMTGTPTIIKGSVKRASSWGPECNSFLHSVEIHNTIAARSYYLKFYSQYFMSLYMSIKELKRVLKPRGQCVIVIQDSYFKDVHVDLPKIATEMARNLGFQSSSKISFPVKQNYADSNVRSLKYRIMSKATEAVLVLKA